MTKVKVLLVDDDEDDLALTRVALEKNNCEVVSAGSVTMALRLMEAQPFDVLLTDLHMPRAGDGFAVVTAMHHFQPSVLTLVVSDFPNVEEAMKALLLEADEILVKPFDPARLADLMNNRAVRNKSAQPKESVATILDREVVGLIERWSSRVAQVPDLAAIPFGAEGRSAYLPQMIKSICERLRSVRSVDVVERPCPAAVTHGQIRHRQGYTAPLIVQESRILQVCIFETIEHNLATVDFTKVLPDIMIIADEVDSQLKQSIASFMNAQSGTGPVPTLPSSPQMTM